VEHVEDPRSSTSHVISHPDANEHIGTNLHSVICHFPLICSSLISIYGFYTMSQKDTRTVFCDNFGKR